MSSFIMILFVAFLMLQTVRGSGERTKNRPQKTHRVSLHLRNEFIPENRGDCGPARRAPLRHGLRGGSGVRSRRNKASLGCRLRAFDPTRSCGVLFLRRLPQAGTQAGELSTRGRGRGQREGRAAGSAHKRPQEAGRGGDSPKRGHGAMSEMGPPRWAERGPRKEVSPSWFLEPCHLLVSVVRSGGDVPR